MDELFSVAIGDILRSCATVPAIMDPTSPHSRIGRGGSPTLELRHWSGGTKDVRGRLLLNPVRRAWLDQSIGMCLWNLTGSDSLEQVAFYNPNAARFSDDAETIRAPWGKRILGSGPGGPFDRALECLRKDPSSLRAVIPVYEDWDLGVASRDVPCLVAVHLLVREGRLDATFMLRSLNPYWVWPYDHFFLSVLVELGALRIGLAAGEMTYCVSSLQLSEDDRALVARAAGSSPEAAHPMPPMPDVDMWELIGDLAKAERRARAYLAAPECSGGRRRWEAACTRLPVWWSDLLRAMVGAYGTRRGWPGHPGGECPDWSLPLMWQEERV